MCPDPSGLLALDQSIDLHRQSHEPIMVMALVAGRRLSIGL